MSKIIPFGYATPNAAERLATLMSDPLMLLIDTRYSPCSRHSQWQQEALQEQYGKRYRWAGQYLGNINYKGGPIEIVNPETGIRGLKMYLDKGYSLILLCACKHYEQCHRKVICDLVREHVPCVEVVL